jgi:BirA family biotin operon repressor/biotin-[acetyl-CoA-carboxylase] ligase
MNVAPPGLLEALADGGFHSGEALARAAGVTRSAVWKQVERLAGLGLEVQRVPGRGYRIEGGLDLLDQAQVSAALGPAARAALEAIIVHRSIDSTNTELSERIKARHAACLAEHQSAGRGRVGRRWVSPFGANLYCSVAWTFDALPPGIQALSLAAGAAVAQAIDPDERFGVRLKWPNDLVAADRKLGGVLVEMRGEPPGATRVVVGVGLNVRMPAAAAAAIDQPWTDLATLGVAAARNALAAAVVDALVQMLTRFASDGFAASYDSWSARDALRGRDVAVSGAGAALRGIARGIDRDGALRLEVDGAVRRMVVGEVSLRSAG